MTMYTLSQERLDAFFVVLSHSCFRCNDPSNSSSLGLRGSEKGNRCSLSICSLHKEQFAKTFKMHYELFIRENNDANLRLLLRADDKAANN